MIDQRALEAAKVVYANYIKNRPLAWEVDDVLEATIEAYEAAKPSPWRPIGEMKLDLPAALALPLVDDLELITIIVKKDTGIWCQRTGRRWDDEELEGAMFRTIDPPGSPDADCCPASTSPAAEEG